MLQTVLHENTSQNISTNMCLKSCLLKIQRGDAIRAFNKPKAWLFSPNIAKQVQYSNYRVGGPVVEILKL